MNKMDELFYEDLDTLPGFTAQFPETEPYNYRRYISDNGISYFVPDSDIDFSAVTEKVTQTEPMLSHLSHLLRCNGMYPTTAWTGISNQEEYFLKAKEDERTIRKTSICLTNYLTGKEIWFKDENYRIPWNDPQGIAAANSSEFVMGILVPGELEIVIENLDQNKFETPVSALNFLGMLDVLGIQYRYYEYHQTAISELEDKSNWTDFSVYMFNSLGKKVKFHASDSSRK